MAAYVLRIACCVVAGLSALVLLPAAGAQKHSKKLKPLETTVENYYGGVFLIGDGGIPNGPCFRIRGRVTAGDFFNQLKSFSTENGIVFKLGQEEVTEFPKMVGLSLTVRDQPCELGLQSVGTTMFLTHDEMSSLKLSLYWKHGVEMRPAGKISVVSTSTEPIEPYAKDLAAELPKRYLWSYDLDVPSMGVPLTDSLVLIFRTAKGHIVARVAARL